MSSLNGVMCNTLTFLNNDFEIAENLNTLLIRHIITNNANSFLLFGNLKENNLVPLEEKIKLIELVLEITQNKIPILIGIYNDSLDEVIDQIEKVGKKFPDLSFMISPPPYEKIGENVKSSFFENILGAINPQHQIYLINNPSQFAGNEIEPDILKKLKEFSNLKGLNDSFYNIKSCKSYIQCLDENFSVFCGMEENYHTFFQLVPLNQRKYSGMISSISNLTNMCSKLYRYALEDEILELLQIQENIKDIRTKLYGIDSNKEMQVLKLKCAFLYLYKDALLKSDKISSLISENIQSQVDSISKGRIEAIVNSLQNEKYIYKLYYIGKNDLYQFDEIINLFSNVEVLVGQGKVKKIKGPYIVDINTLYKVRFENNRLVFRFLTSPLFHTGNLIREKLLFPFLDGNLTPGDVELKERVKKIVNTKKGSYIFNKEKPPIIPVYNLVYYDETRETVPYLFSVQEYIRGKPLFQLINQFISEGKNSHTNKFISLFKNLGEILGTLHKIQFDTYCKNIIDIGKKKKSSYTEFLESELDRKIQQARKNQIEFTDEIRDFYKNNISLIEDETEFVLLHNNFYSQNIIVKEEVGSIKVNGIVNFDNWCVGSRAQDFIKIEYWILKPINNPSLNNSFYKAYSNFYHINNEFMRKIDLYKLFWLLDEYNIEFELIKKSDQLNIVKTTRVSLDSYLNEIKSIIR